MAKLTNLKLQTVEEEQRRVANLVSEVSDASSSLTAAVVESIDIEQQKQYAATAKVKRRGEKKKIIRLVYGLLFGMLLLTCLIALSLSLFYAKIWRNLNDSTCQTYMGFFSLSDSLFLIAWTASFIAMVRRSDICVNSAATLFLLSLLSKAIAVGLFIQAETSYEEIKDNLIFSLSLSAILAVLTLFSTAGILSLKSRWQFYPQDRWQRRFNPNKRFQDVINHNNKLASKVSNNITDYSVLQLSN